jgi:general stress protein 26
MQEDHVVSAAKELIRAHKPFVLATVDRSGYPQMRWMGAAVLDDPLTVYMAAGAGSRKMDQIEANSKSEIIFQNQDFSRVATISGRCRLVDDPETKRRVWDAMPAASHYFSGPEDSNFGVIEFTAERVEMLGLEPGMSTSVADL